MSSSSGAAEAATADVQVDTDKKSEDEQPEGTPADTNIELSDPAILAVSVVKYRYSREELLNLRETPLSQARHECLDKTYNSCYGFWDPERWHCDRKRSETPVENETSNNEPDNHRRRPGDPRERIRKEQDGIVLSPQRRSFNSGCFVPVRGQGIVKVRGQVPTRNRAHSPLGKAETTHIVHRELPPGTRRIGSGRIVRDWDYPEKNDNDSGGFVFRREHRESERDERFERRSFGRDFEISRDKDKERHISRNGHYNERRRISSENREEEPEWFSGGPSSQSDTIELRGFDDSDKSSKKKQNTGSKKRANKERAITKVSEMQPLDEKKETTTTSPNDTAVTGARSTSTPPDGMASSGQPQSPSAVEQGGGGDAVETKNTEVAATIVEQAALNFTEDFWKLPELTNGLGGDGDHAAESRFSRFFKNRESPVKTVESRRSSIHDDHHLIKNILNDITEPTVSIPGDSESYFAPISPAANTGGAVGAQTGPQAGTKPMNIMDVLQRGKQPVPADMPPNMKNTVPGNIMSLEELEAHMRQSGAGDHSMAQKSAQNKPDEDMAAFKRLLAQVSGGHAVSATNGPIQQKTQPPLTLMEMLSHSQKQDELRAASAHMMGAGSPNQPPLQLANDLAMKVNLGQQRQQQMEMLKKIARANHLHHRQQLSASPLPEFNLAQSRELLSRPEAQAILQGLKRGDITPQHLYQQLANPALQPRHRELLLTILKLTGSGGGGGGLGPSPRVLSPVPPLSMFQQQQQQQQQQQLRVSPLPPNAMHQRIPSPRELQVHTQNILQRALIKKKLEEQQENYRKKQEMQQRGQSPNSSGLSPAKSVSSPTPLAFTPTSVLRKMTADKDEGKDGNKNDGHGKIPQGRPVTGIRPQQNQPQQLPNQWSSQYSVKQPAGRPIVKASTNYQQQQQAVQQEQQQQFFQQRLYNQQQQQLQQQQQQQRKAAQQYTSGAPLNPSNSQYPQQYSNQFQQLTQQQLRAQHQQQHVRVPPQQQQQQSPYSQQQQWHQLLNSQQQTYDNRSSQLGRGGLDGGDLSPTSNQLARWFSPDLLERARAGKLPNMPTASLAQHALSLEEIERQTAPPIHN